MKRLICWWLGCEEHPQDPAPPGYADCRRCGRIVDYGDMVGDTRHRRFTEAARYWLFRRWIPVKCGVCGRRWSECPDDNDHLPF